MSRWSEAPYILAVILCSAYPAPQGPANTASPAVHSVTVRHNMPYTTRHTMAHEACMHVHGLHVACSSPNLGGPGNQMPKLIR